MSAIFCCFGIVLSKRYVIINIEVMKNFAVGGMDMGIYLNPSNGKFRKAVTSEIYVDKSDLITKLNERVGKEN